MEDQVVNFYDNIEPLFKFVDKKHVDYRKLVQVVHSVLELVHQAVGSPASSFDKGSLFNREVSPDLDINVGLAVAQYAYSSVGIGHQEQDKISPSVRAISNNFGNGNTPAEEEDGSDEDEDDGIRIESSTPVNPTLFSSASAKHKIAKSSTEGPAKAVKVDSVFEVYKDVWGDRTYDVDPPGRPPDWEKGYCCNWLRYEHFNQDKTKAWAHSILWCSSWILHRHMWSQEFTISAICRHLPSLDWHGNQRN